MFVVYVKFHTVNCNITLQIQCINHEFYQYVLVDKYSVFIHRSAEDKIDDTAVADTLL
jgi:hypothetical protein